MLLQVSLEPKLISDLLFDKNIHINMPCSGREVCLKCRVFASGDLSALTEIEKSCLTKEDIQNNIRLACTTYVTGKAEVSIPEIHAQKIVSKGYMPSFGKNPPLDGVGIAVDIGTTTVVVYLCNLNTNEIIGMASAKNPQGNFGADVISRIQKSMQGNDLRTPIINCIDSLIKSLTSQIPLKLVITGNTTMLYLLTGTDVTPLSAAPFKISTAFGAYTEILGCPTYLPACICAYVGADITTAILASDMMFSDKTSLLVDIGTNGEMALHYKGKLYCCSTAAGPAFEGAGLEMGMNSSMGAIDKVNTKDISFSTIENGKAVGICGSGIVDAVAALLSNGIMDETGIINTELTYRNQPAFCFSGTDVYITQRDIRAIQLAKSAICAGIYALINAAEAHVTDIDNFYIAGGFGSFLNIENAAIIGLIPSELASKATYLGNAAGMGANMIIFSEAMRMKSESIALTAQNLDLSTDTFFMDKYVDCMLFE